MRNFETQRQVLIKCFNKHSKLMLKLKTMVGVKDAKSGLQCFGRHVLLISLIMVRLKKLDGHSH
jgi:hypothetical protein